MKKLICVTLMLILSFSAISTNAALMYALDGRSVDVAETQIDDWRKVGWYTPDDIYTGIIQPAYHIYKNAYDYMGMIEMVGAYLPFTYATPHESSMYAIRTEAMDLWRVGSGRPVGIANPTIHNGNTIVADFVNISYLPIKDLVFCYTCHDAQGNKMYSEYAGLQHLDANIQPGETLEISGYVGAQGVSILENLRVTSVVFADGSEWIGD